MDASELNFDPNSATLNLKPQEHDFFGVVKSTIAERNTLWDIEQNFDKEPWVRWMNTRWKDTFFYAFLYVIVVFGGKKLMQDRPRFELRSLLALWNIGLGVFSALGAFRCIEESAQKVAADGLYKSAIEGEFYSGPAGFWVLLFTLSKLVEFGDTLFIVARKQQLIFLHWYHHLSTLVYVWNSYAEQTSTGRWCIMMNYTIHALMYNYYALKAMKFNVPRFIMVTITSLQTIQMFIGSSLNFYVFYLKLNDVYVHQSWPNLCASTVMYVSYLILFSNFFYQTYFVKKPAPAKKAN